VNAEVDKRGVVTISGYYSRGPGYAITVKVIAPDGNIDYVNETASDINGNFAFVYNMSGNKEGHYQVTIGADGIINVVRTYFDYYPGKMEDIKLSVDVNASIDKSKKVTVFGAISTGDGQQLNVLIRDPAGKIEFIDYCISRNGGKYEISYYMKNMLKGRYQVTVGSSGLESPVSTYFDYNSVEVSVKAGISKNKKVTITGNIGSGAGQQVNIKITDPSNKVEYVGNTISRSDGEFSLEYTMKNNTTGKYLVTVGADGMPNTAETYFIYDPSNVELKSLYLENVQLNPAFSPTVTKYSDVVYDNIEYTKVIAEASNENQTITVNSVLVKSGEASGRIPLYLGLNTVRVNVTSPDGMNSMTYVVSINRQLTTSYRQPSEPPPQPSGNADLSDLVLHGAMFEYPLQFASSDTEYLVVMDPESNDLIITPTASDDGARITVNGTPVVSGSPSPPIEVGENGTQVDILVTAEDGTTKTYILMVIRANYASSDAFLAAERDRGRFYVLIDIGWYTKISQQQGIPEMQYYAILEIKVRDSC